MGIYLFLNNGRQNNGLVSELASTMVVSFIEWNIINRIHTLEESVK